MLDIHGCGLRVKPRQRLRARALDVRPPRLAWLIDDLNAGAGMAGGSPVCACREKARHMLSRSGRSVFMGMTC